MPDIYLSHVSITTADLDCLTRFYERTIGLRLVAIDHSPLHEPRRLGVYADANGIALLAVEQPEFDLKNADFDEPRAVDHITFEANGSEFDDAVCRLVATGASSGARHADGPMSFVWFVDPDGRDCRICRRDPAWTPPQTVNIVACTTSANRGATS